MSLAKLTSPVRTNVLVVRHAEVHNPQDIVYGRLPGFGLNARGREQAERSAAFLAARKVSMIYTSPLLRARHTAAILGRRLHVPIRESSKLIEVRTCYQGSPNSILLPGFSFFEPLKEPRDETIQDIFDRFHRFLRSMVRRHPGETVVAISHGDPITIMRIGLEGKPLTARSMHSAVYAARASVTQVEIRPEEPVWLSYFNVAQVEELKL